LASPVSSWNEWDPLEEVIVGTARGAAEIGYEPGLAAYFPEGSADRAFRGRPVGDLMLRGRSETLRAWEPLPKAVADMPETAQYKEAFAKLEAGDAAAMPAFAALVGSHAEDALAGFHLRRLLNGAKGVRLQLE